MKNNAVTQIIFIKIQSVKEIVCQVLHWFPISVLHTCHHRELDVREQ